MQLKENSILLNKLMPKDMHYPQLLKEINNPPSPLYSRGELPKQDLPIIAMVGTRKASSYGKLLAHTIAKELANRNIIIVSGLAMGIDAAAHEGSLSVNGTTLAVLANGLNSIYPRHHEQLASKILKKGALLSEYEPDSPALPHQFLERNRIISGICNAVIIIEAPERSGALSTARHAADQGRDVYVVPGPANHPNFIGSHRLIRDGARLVTCAQDILDDLNLDLPYESKDSATIVIDPNHQIIFEIIKSAGEPISVDKIISQSTLEPRIIAQAVTFLLMQEKIKETEKGYTVWR